ncbi:MAG: response regulator [Candidatus Delongbacteria bacterium]|nr:response regulator [Candidatus Delongbacteria bacterium]MBN2834071.1 response regulator [Candidatus Delongbacteria bacterium]
MFSAIIIDDEEIARYRLRQMLTEEQDIDIIDEAYDGVNAIEKINYHQPDLIFLDIEMPGFNGFEVLEKITCSPLVIFTTAYDEFALKAFSTFSVDYLVKPISKSSLSQAITKFNRFSGDKTLQNNVEILMNHLKSKKTKKLSIKVGNEILFVNYDDIVYVKSEDKYSIIYTYDLSFVAGETISELAEKLPSNFKRIHRSYIVNQDKIAKIVKWYRNQHKFVMADKLNSEIPVNKENNKNIESFLQ